MTTPSFFLGAAYVPSLQKAVQEVQDASVYLLGCERAGEGVLMACECHRAALRSLRKFLTILKVI